MEKVVRMYGVMKNGEENAFASIKNGGASFDLIAYKVDMIPVEERSISQLAVEKTSTNEMPLSSQRHNENGSAEPHPIRLARRLRAPRGRNPTRRGQEPGSGQ